MHVLTEREFEIVCLVTAGIRDEEISAKLGIGESELRKYLIDIYGDPHEAVTVSSVAWLTPARRLLWAAIHKLDRGRSSQTH